MTENPYRSPASDDPAILNPKQSGGVSFLLDSIIEEVCQFERDYVILKILKLRSKREIHIEQGWNIEGCVESDRSATISDLVRRRIEGVEVASTRELIISVTGGIRLRIVGDPRIVKKKILWGFNWSKVALGGSLFVIFGGLAALSLMGGWAIGIFLALGVIGFFIMLDGLMGENGIW